ncbi:MAG: hypothetical protein Q8J80_08625 [Gallionella sp.]|nr:hypothetical protein [Gallionella sp.]
MTDVHIAFERNFDTLLLDSVDFLLDAKDQHPDLDESRRAARVAIMYTLLLLEAAANTCIEHLNLERAIHNEIDRLPVLSKFDFYLRTNFRNRSLDRGIHQIEWVKELKGLRDGTVHLKSHKVKWNGRPDESMTAEAERTKVLKVATNPKFWSVDDAVIIAKATHGFLHYFFKEKCKYSPKKVASLLFSESDTPGDDNHFCPCLYKATKSQLLALGIDLTYIKVAWV